VETNLQEIIIMLRSMFTAISSLGLHQKFLDVVSDNLANANTTGYKASRVLFQDQFAQLMSPGSGPSGDLGGVNPSQVGLGVRAGAIAPVFNQGVMQSTGRNFDVAINGDGFLMYNQGEERLYSRDGALDLDAAGYMVNSSTGARVQGWLADQTATPPIDTNNPVDSIHISRNGTLARATSNENLGGNLDSNTAVNTNYATDPNGKVITTMSVYDSLGEPQSVTVQFTRTSSNEWRWDITKNGTGTGTVTFDTAGQYSKSTGTGSATAASTVSIPTSSGSTNPLVLQTLDLSKMTMTSGANDVSAVSQDGLPAGTISDVYIAPNTGEIFVFYTNGLKQLTGQLALARFANPSGLLRQGSNLYQVGANTGEPEIGTATTGGRGSINSAYLEASNVDMAQEFTNMILAQRGFQASSRVITTSDEIMQELVNLKR
jgi:flagellar hook protein FlgE